MTSETGNSKNKEESKEEKEIKKEKRYNFILMLTFLLLNRSRSNIVY